VVVITIGRRRRIRNGRFVERQVINVLALLCLIIHVTRTHHAKSKTIYDAWYLDCQTTLRGGVNDVLVFIVFLGLFRHVTRVQEPKAKSIYNVRYSGHQISGRVRVVRHGCKVFLYRWCSHILTHAEQSEVSRGMNGAWLSERDKGTVEAIDEHLLAAGIPAERLSLFPRRTYIRAVACGRPCTTYSEIPLGKRGGTVVGHRPPIER